MSRLTDVFIALLDASNPPVDVQQRIYEYAARIKSTPLMVKLASHPNLDRSVDEQVKSVRTAQVVAARLSNPSRTSDEIVSALTTESRVSVLVALADNPALTAAAQCTIATKVTNKSVLLGFVKNTNVDEEIRFLAANNFVNISRTTSDGCMNMKRVYQLIEIEDSLEGFLESTYIDSNDIELLYAAAMRYTLDEDAQHRLVVGFVARYTIGLSVVEPAKSYYAYNDAQSQLLELGELLCERGHIGSGAYEELLKAFDRTLSCFGKGSYSRSRFEAVRKNIKQAKTDRFKKYREQFEAATTEEQMTTVIAQILTAYRTGDGLSNSFIREIARKVAASPVATEAHLAALAENIHLLEGDALIKSANTPAKQAVVFMESLFHLKDCDSVLDIVPDPVSTLREIVKLINHTGSFYAVSMVAASRHFNSEHWKLFSIDTLLSCDEIAGRGDKLVELFQDALADTHIFEALDTLSGEFEGSVEELLIVASKL